MPVEQYDHATEYLANEIVILRGDVSDITAVGVYHTTDIQDSPEPGDFTMVTLIDGVTNPTDPLAESGKIDILSLLGPKAGADLDLSPGTYQRFVLIQTASEDIIRRIDTVTII